MATFFEIHVTNCRTAWHYQFEVAQSPQNPIETEPSLSKGYTVSYRTF